MSCLVTKQYRYFRPNLPKDTPTGWDTSPIASWGKVITITGLQFFSAFSHDLTYLWADGTKHDTIGYNTIRYNMITLFIHRISTALTLSTIYLPNIKTKNKGCFSWRLSLNNENNGSHFWITCRTLPHVINLSPQIITTHPGRRLTVHYPSMAGEMFELEVHDGNTINATNLTLVNQWTGVNQAVTASTSSGHELYIRFRYNGRYGATIRFLITDERGMKNNNKKR